ncbi:uncharacterized protein E0L32_006357 [Thyridium curvatum]|uniref:Disintegrin and metalloproteinase domain-containing protein B n=1 Tax=Thyridium curvatum TaxID=1093900 RepID=A0A507B0A9_9PEZI|nr:uncharacterized protein E0L32_006357 [Thyridium curvatum]TPX13157.1 hypothetical protein E0L32_006357 [Thyridium curvatum]
MLILRIAACLAAYLFIQTSIAHSTQRNPLRSISRLEEPVLHTPSHRVHAASTFELSFLLQDVHQKVRLSLQPNHDILPRGASIQHLNDDGTVTIEEINRHDHRIFRGDTFVRYPGHSEWTNVGWARINVHRDGDKPVFEGAFRIDGIQHNIHTVAHYREDRLRGDPEILGQADDQMIVWRNSDIMRNDDANLPDELKKRGTTGPSCTSDHLDFNMDKRHPVYSTDQVTDDGYQSIPARFLFGRDIDQGTSGNGAGVNLGSTIGKTAGCPTTRKVALVGVATDCTYTAKFPSKANVTANIIQVVNTASQLYESTFNISLGIQNLVISNETCPGTPRPDRPWNVDCKGGQALTMLDRLNLFSKWRGQSTDNNAYWSLFSTCSTDTAVGLAWLGQLCVQGSQDDTSNGRNQTTAATNIIIKTAEEWQVFAHETGHTFGAVHDCVSQTCSDGTVTKQQCCPRSASTCDAGGGFIMNPSTSPDISKFSPCSVGNICSALQRNSVKSTCLSSNRDVVTISGARCGNGIVEADEDCDCGGEAGCGSNSCCDPKTCKFTAGSRCDPANEECCTQSCQFASNGTLCRASTGACDPAETCSGSSALCPADVTAPDGQACGDDGKGLACASGQCTSRDLQCKTLMGSFTTNNDTYACGQDGCQLSCASPEFGPRTCMSNMQNFLDGTGCEGGGRCKNGKCQGSSLAREIGDWFSRNKKIVIIVASVVGGLVVIAILSCCISSYRRRQRRPRKGVVPPQPQPPAGWNSYGSNHPPVNNNNNRWADPRMTGGSGPQPLLGPDGGQWGGGGAPPPPPSYYQADQQWGPPRRQTSARWA